MEEESTNCVKSVSRFAYEALYSCHPSRNEEMLLSFCNKQTLLYPSTKMEFPKFKNKMYYHSLANAVDFGRSRCFDAPGFYFTLLVTTYYQNNIHFFRYCDWTVKDVSHLSSTNFQYYRGVNKTGISVIKSRISLSV
jgi:hypothetical protein